MRQLEITYLEGADENGGETDENGGETDESGGKTL